MLPSGRKDWITLVGSMTWIALSYTGFNAAIYVAGEAKEARKTVPLAMFVATIVVTGLYLLLNYIFVFAPAPKLIAGDPNVAGIAAEAVGGSSLRQLVRIIVTVAMISSVFSLLIAGPRVYQQMAIDGAMPKLIRGKTGNPRLAIILQSLLAIITVFAGTLLEIMQYLGLTLSVSGALAVGSLFWMRGRIGSAPLRSWEVIPAVIYLTFTLALIAAGYLEQRSQFYAMLVTFALGCVFYFAGDALKTRGDSESPYAR
jgi:APA family basic amino acid/polyamine antiporter